MLRDTRKAGYCPQRPCRVQGAFDHLAREHQAMADFGPLIGPDELRRHLGERGWRIIDCRFDLMNPAAGREAWEQAHIPGAVFADLDDDLAAPVTAASGRHPLPDPRDACETFGRLGVDSDTRVVVYDGGPGAFAARAWWMLRWLGHDTVALLDGGWAEWLARGQPVESGAVFGDPAHFSGTPRDELVLGSAELQKHGAEALLLVDARDEARFAGKQEPIDAVAGHVPGALNRPFSDSLRPDGRWKSGDQLRSLWQETLGDRLGEPWAVMCGSGVTACHLAISAALAGLPEPRLYEGSWSEWIRDPDRPVATGT